MFVPAAAGAKGTAASLLFYQHIYQLNKPTKKEKHVFMHVFVHLARLNIVLKQKIPFIFF